MISVANPSDFQNPPIQRIAISPSSAFFAYLPRERLIKIDNTVYEVVGVPSDHEIDVIPYKGDQKPRVSISNSHRAPTPARMTSSRQRGAAVTKLFRMKKM